MAVYTNFIFRGILWLRDILWYNRHMFWYRLLSFDVGDMEKWRDFNASAFTQRKLLKVYTCLDDNSRTIIGLPKFETRTHIYARANYPEVAISSSLSERTRTEVPTWENPNVILWRHYDVILWVSK